MFNIYETLITFLQKPFNYVVNHNRIGFVKGCIKQDFRINNGGLQSFGRDKF